MFNEGKYKKCINHLISAKVTIIVLYTIVFLAIGGTAGYAIDIDTSGMIVGAIVGGIIGIIIGISSTWRIEMRIQEAYWRIDSLNELKNSNVNLKSASSKVSSQKETEVNSESK